MDDGIASNRFINFINQQTRMITIHWSYILYTKVVDNLRLDKVTKLL